MRELATFLGGIGLLIFAYLVFTHGTQVVTVAEGLASAGATTISVLQGNASGVGGFQVPGG